MGLKMWTSTRLIGPALLLALGAAAAPSAWAQSGPNHSAWHVRTPTNEGQGFAIQNPDAGVNCVVVTAAHVVQPGDTVVLTGLDRRGPAPRRVEVQARVHRFYADGQIAVLLPASPLPGCDGLRIGDARAAEQSDRILRTPHVQAATGEAVHGRLLIESVRADSMELAGVGVRQVGPGWSGGLVTLDGQPLAVVQRIDNARPLVLASRLDYSRAFVDKYAAWPAPAAARPAWDTSGLPADYRKVYSDAIEVKRQAEIAQRVAKGNALLAEDAKVRATAGAARHGKVVFKLSEYFGEIADGMAQGYGEVTFKSGTQLGDVYLGSWQIERRADNGVYSIEPQGLGVVRYADSVNRHVLYEGGLQAWAYHGHGVLQFQSGDIVWTRWDKGGNAAPMMLFRKSDGYWFTGTAAEGRWHGPGILWDNAGQVHSWGVWREGRLVEPAPEPKR